MAVHIQKLEVEESESGAMSGFSISGLGSGIDWTNYLNSIYTAETNALSRTLGARQVKVSAQQTAMSQVKSLIEAFKGQLSNFEFVGDFKSKLLNTSNSTQVIGSASLTAINQSATVLVDRLATNETWTGKFSAVDAQVNSSGVDQTFTITVHGEDKVITVPSGSTLTDLTNLINNGNYGLSATVFNSNDGTAEPIRLSIVDNTTGKFNPDQTAGVNFNLAFASTLDVTPTGLVGGTPTIEGTDSRVYMNQSPAAVGSCVDPIYRDGNVLDNVIPGVTLTLNSARTSTTDWVTLTVTESTNDASSKIASLVKSYNTMIGALKQAVAYNPNEDVQSNPTAGDSTLNGVIQSLQNSVMRALTTLPEGSTITSLTDIGITSKYNTSGNSSGNGQLEFDQAKFTSLLQSNYDDVVAFFQGKTVDTNQFEGWAKRVKTTVDSLIAPIDGVVTSKITSLEQQYKDLNEEITTKVERINAKQERLKSQFARLEAQLGALNSQQSALQSALNSIALNNQAIARGN